MNRAHLTAPHLAPFTSALEAERAKAGIEVRRFAGPSAYVGKMHPIRVVHLTDIHVGRVTPMHVQETTVRLTNALKPDVVVITGDFVCHSQAYLGPLAELMSKITAPVYGVLGNHDHWSGAPEVRDALRKGGVELLDNTHTLTTLGGQKVQLLGLDDAYTGNADRAAALRGLRSDVPVLGLSHIAEEADGLWFHDVPFVLSGHTHAGQITVARLHELALGKLVGHKYVHGMYGSRSGATKTGAVYVGAGIGAAVVPLRIGERGRREIAVFELGVAAGTFDEHHGEQAPLEGRAPTPSLMAKRREQVEKKKAKRERKS